MSQPECSTIFFRKQTKKGTGLRLSEVGRINQLKPCKTLQTKSPRATAILRDVRWGPPPGKSATHCTSSCPGKKRTTLHGGTLKVGVAK